MIGYVRGILKLKAPPMLMLDVAGIGYEVEAPMSTFYELKDVGDEVTLHTHFVVREDAQLLYGFTRVSDRDLFRHLLKVNGVGPRMGLAILSTMNTADFLECVSNGDIVSLTRIPGVGKKTAERLLLDLRDRLADFGQAADASLDQGDMVAGGESSSRDAISALEALGYKPADASRAVRGISGKQESTEAIIREALRFLAS